MFSLCFPCSFPVFSICFLCISCGPVVKYPSSALEFEASKANYPSKEYLIKVGDRLEVKFFKNPELNELVQVRPDGRISIQLAHDVKAAGTTPKSLTDALTAKYEAELKNPQITVLLRSFSQQNVFINGEVYRPLLIPLEGYLTALQGISLAGGFLDTARMDEVVLIRRTPDQPPQVFQLNLAKVIDGSDTSQDIQLTPQDIVFVPKSSIADIDLWIDQYIRQTIPLLDVSANVNFVVQ